MTTERSVQSDPPFLPHGKALHSAVNRRNGCNSAPYRLSLPTDGFHCVHAAQRISDWTCFMKSNGFEGAGVTTRSHLHAVIVCFAIGLLGGCTARQDEKAVLAAVQAMFDGMAHRDAAAIRA